jgi:hypothetical protein
MPVVVNEFEVVADAPATRSAEESGDAADSGPAAEMDPGELALLLRAMEVSALRAWAH